MRIKQFPPPGNVDVADMVGEVLGFVAVAIAFEVREAASREDRHAVAESFKGARLRVDVHVLPTRIRRAPNGKLRGRVTVVGDQRDVRAVRTPERLASLLLAHTSPLGSEDSTVGRGSRR